MDVHYELNGQRFVWDKDKYDDNVAKHDGVTFEEAAVVLLRDDTKFYLDDEHSQDEERFLAIGFGSIMRLLVVCHCMRENDEVIRIISARKAERSEQSLFLDSAD